GFNRALLLPGISVSVAEMVEALARAGGDEAVRRLRFEPDPVIARIVAGWPRGIKARRAQSMGIEADAGIDEIVRNFVEDDLPAQKRMVAG
ncbi:MAG TPA: NAD-dependent epimerase, partial [Stellaceae bacterium]|nr:NAD-dependent epimerase [Stellaceae bacterium]